MCVCLEFLLETSIFVSCKTRKGTRKKRDQNILKLSLSFLLILFKAGQLNQCPFFVTHLLLLISGPCMFHLYLRITLFNLFPLLIILVSHPSIKGNSKISDWKFYFVPLEIISNMAYHTGRSVIDLHLWVLISKQ